MIDYYLDVVKERIAEKKDFTVARHGIAWQFVRYTFGWNVHCSRARLELYAEKIVFDNGNIKLIGEATDSEFGIIYLHDFTIAYKGVKE